jgi:PAS domain S-box-containing protein
MAAADDPMARMKPYVAFIIKSVAVFMAVTLLHVVGALDFIDNKLSDMRFRLAQSEATDRLVVVKIDAASLDQVGVWPWPRHLYADLLDRLFAAGAEDVALDIDFSSESVAAEDARLAEALARYGSRVILPVFKQRRQTSDVTLVHQAGDVNFIYTQPLPRFRQGARLASLNITVDPDGVVRQMGIFDHWPGSVGYTVLLPALLAGTDRVDPFRIDYGIRKDSIPQLPFTNVLQGNFDPAVVRGNHVIVGASATELGDSKSVPLVSAMPGVFVEALATDSLLQGRDLQRASKLLAALVTLLIVFGAGWRFRVWSWGIGLACTAAIILGLEAVAVVAQTQFPVIVDTAPWIVATLLTYCVGLTGRIEDQSVRLLAQGLALRHQDAFMRRVVNNTFDGLLTIDGMGTIRSFNPAAQRIFDHSPEEIIGQNFSALLTGTAGFGDGSGATTALLSAVGRSGSSRGIMGRRRDGTAFPMDLAVTEMQEGGAAVYIALVRDISARAAAESMAAQAQQQLVDALDSISEAFVLYDAQDRILLFNQKFRELHGPCANLITVGARFDDVARAVAAQGLIPEAAGRIQEWVRERVLQHVNPTGSFDMELADGRWQRIAERRTRDGGIVGTMTEITEEKRRERELRRARDGAELANRSKSEFLANMSHELRTPLNAIIGFSELMKNEVLGTIAIPAYAGYVRDIHDSANHLLNIINDILDLSRIEAGKLKLFETAVELGGAAQGTARLVSERAADSGVRVTTEVEKELPTLWGDERLVKQILINLLANAVKFTPRGGSVAVRAFKDPDGKLGLSVVDTGIGIADSDLARVMEPFGQADGSLRRRYEGTGLGLPLVRSFVELHGATFGLKSQVGSGTTATVLFPIERTMLRAAGQTEDAPRRSEPSNVTSLRSATAKRE